GHPRRAGGSLMGAPGSAAARRTEGPGARLGPLAPPLLLLAVMWIAETVDLILGGQLDGAGIDARNTDGLLGVLLAPFLHGGFEHLMSNTVPLLVLGTLVATAGRALFWRVTATVILLGGLSTWLIAPPATITIGASGLVFGYLGYLLVAGVRTRHWRDLLVGAVVLLVYGTLLIGALPWAVAANVSWQAHLTGALAGALAAWWYAPRPRTAIRSGAGTSP
ncbi:MAG: rhomboid family intramembrane serine protease, partial [Candidatus Nanopelagicales bacterium]